MFKLATMQTVRWPVTVSIPQDGGKTVKATFHATFLMLKQPEFDEVYKSGGNDTELLRKVTKGWESDLVGEDGAPMSFTPENVEAMVTTSYVRLAMTNAYLELFHGKEAAAQKN